MNAAGFLQPLSDLIAKRYGAVVSILMVCPIGETRGNIEMRRYVFRLVSTVPQPMLISCD